MLPQLEDRPHRSLRRRERLVRRGGRLLLRMGRRRAAHVNHDMRRIRARDRRADGEGTEAQSPFAEEPLRGRERPIREIRRGRAKHRELAQIGRFERERAAREPLNERRRLAIVMNRDATSEERVGAKREIPAEQLFPSLSNEPAGMTSGVRSQGESWISPSKNMKRMARQGWPLLLISIGGI